VDHSLGQWVAEPGPSLQAEFLRPPKHRVVVHAKLSAHRLDRPCRIRPQLGQPAQSPGGPFLQSEHHGGNSSRDTRAGNERRRHLTDSAPGQRLRLPGGKENEGPALGVVAGSGPCPASREQRLNRRLRSNRRFLNTTDLRPLPPRRHGQCHCLPPPRRPLDRVTMRFMALRLACSYRPSS
jgi:hypothetical protein